MNVLVKLIKNLILIGLFTIAFNSYAQQAIVPAISLAEINSESDFASIQYKSIPNALSYLVPTTSQNSISPLIIGGTTALRGEFPEFVQLWLDGQDGFLYAICGGTLIANNKVLTAAHCSLEPTGLYYVTPNFYSFNDTITQSDFIAISQKNTHPDFNNTTLDYDIAIFTMTQNSSTSKASVYGGSNQLVGNNSTVIGTGLINSVIPTFPNSLQKVTTPIVTNQACDSVYIDNITNRMICAGFPGNGLGLAMATVVDHFGQRFLGKECRLV